MPSPAPQASKPQRTISDYPCALADVPLGSHLMVFNHDRGEVPFVKDEPTRVTRLTDAAYLSLETLGALPCRIVSREEAVAAARAEREAASAFQRGAPAP